jgi:hypothetical protein
MEKKKELKTLIHKRKQQIFEAENNIHQVYVIEWSHRARRKELFKLKFYA